MNKDLSILEKRLGVKFKDKNLLIEALTHPSYANENGSINHNQRLEFLGDAVLELAMSTYLYNENSEFDEGKMTKRRAQSVCEEALYIYSKTFDLASFILLGHGEEQSGGRSKPSLVSDAFEAVLGAIYLDQGFHAALDVFNRIVLPHIDDVEIIQDYKTRLQELVRTDKMNLDYQIIKEEGPSHNKRFEAIVKLNDDIIMGHGIGRTKKEAEQQAAKEALQKCEKR